MYATRWRSPRRSWAGECGPQRRAAAAGDAARGPRGGARDRERALHASMDARQLQRFAARGLRLPYLAARSRAPGLFHSDGGRGRGAPSQPVDRRGPPAQRPRQRFAARGARARAAARREEPVPRSAAEQCAGSGVVCALRFPPRRRAPRLLSRALRARGRPRVHGRALMGRRELILAEMGLAPIWRLRRASSNANEAQSEAPVTEPRGGADSAKEWIELKQLVSGCVQCGLHETRTQTVFGVGDPHAQWTLIGEAPGAEEDRLGDPFVGQAGRLLDNMLAAIGLDRRKNVYIANVLKGRPPGNRNPEPEEVEKCTPFLKRQIALIQPKLIIAMGRFAAQTLLASEASIASLRGRVYRYEGVPLIVTYHPAYLLRSLPDKSKAWADLLFAKKTMAAL